MKFLRITAVLLPTCLLLSTAFPSCDEEEVYTPRPRGYFRIELPEKKYVSYSAECPYEFEIPSYAAMYRSAAPNAEPCWRDLNFGPFKATMYISYKPVQSDSALANFINQSWELTEAHSKVSTGLRDSLIIREKDRVFGSVQLLGGNAATQMQFYFTDSAKHFLRGSLYFYAAPNKDSIQPVLDYLKKDIYHLAATLKWKDVPLPDEKPRSTTSTNQP